MISNYRSPMGVNESTESNFNQAVLNYTML